MSEADLQIRLFLFGLVALFALDAIKSAGWAKVGLWGAAAMCFLGAVFLAPLQKMWPAAAGVAASLAANPLAWFVMVAVGFLVGRGYWSGKSGEKMRDLQSEKVEVPAHDPQPDTAPAAPDGSSLSRRFTTMQNDHAAILSDIDKMKEEDARLQGAIIDSDNAIEALRRNFGELTLKVAKMAHAYDQATEARRAMVTLKLLRTEEQELFDSILPSAGPQQPVGEMTIHNYSMMTNGALSCGGRVLPDIFKTFTDERSDLMNSDRTADTATRLKHLKELFDKQCGRLEGELTQIASIKMADL